MEQEELPRLYLMPVIPRLDRLDRVLDYIEEKHNLSGRYEADLVPTESSEQCKPLVSALEEVPVKGTLMERVASLEHRVLKLTLELEGERLKSFMLPVPESCKCDSPVKQKEDAPQAAKREHKKGMLEIKATEDKGSQLPSDCTKKNRRIHPIPHYKRWLTWFQIGCRSSF
ncbi:uncharacterized protein [Typha angustifolia]|uniref:uncharacterized protein isoform X2 n=1 Tax=Typha angustifolia TaxID=59011 RepID=UPI003C2C48EA